MAFSRLFQLTTRTFGTANIGDETMNQMHIATAAETDLKAKCRIALQLACVHHANMQMQE